MMKLFTGCNTAHGVFKPEGFEGAKQLGKCLTIREEPTAAKWNAHLIGELGIGIIPITEENKCWWAAIDIDIYPLNFTDLLTKIKDFPFVVCQSKSGGAHLYLFLESPFSAKDVREYLRNQISIIGL